MEHPDHNAFFEMHRRREQLRRKVVILTVLHAALTVAGLLAIGVLIGMALTTAEAMPAFIADAHIRARG